MSGTHTNLGGMNDGRAFTNYHDSCVLNSSLMSKTQSQPWDMHAFKQNMMSTGLDLVRQSQGQCGPHDCRDLGMGVPTQKPGEYKTPEPYTPPISAFERL